MSQSCCLGDVLAVVLHPGDLRPTASASRTDTANHHPRVLAQSVHLEDVDLAEEAGAVEAVEAEAEAEVEGSETRTGATGRAAIHRTVAHHLGDAGVQATTAGVRAAVRLQGGGSAIIALREAVEVEVADDGAQAIRTLATGVTAGTAAAAVTVVVVGDERTG